VSQSNQQKRRSKSVLLKSGTNPVFGRGTKEGIEIAIKIEDKSGLRMYKTNKGVYFAIPIPLERLPHLAFLAIRRYLPMAGKGGKTSSGYQEISFDELLSSIKEKGESKVEGEEVPFE